MLGCWANEAHIQKYGYCARMVSTSIVGLDEKGHAWFQNVAPKLIERVAWQDSPLPWLEQQSRHYPWLPSRVGGLHIGKVVYDASGQRSATGYLVSVHHAFKASSGGLQAFTTLGLDRVLPNATPEEYPDKVRAFARGLQHQKYVTAANGRNQALRDAPVAPGPYAGITVAGAGFMRPSMGTVGDRVGCRKIGGLTHYHKGTDLKSDAGLSVVAPQSGKVTFSGYRNDLGNCVFIRDIGGYLHLLGHLAAPSSFRAGQEITQGALVGTMGDTGASNGVHLHWQVFGLDGKVMDPIGG